MDYEFSGREIQKLYEAKGFEMRLTEDMALSIKVLMASRDSAILSNEITTKQKLEIIMRLEREMMLRMNFITIHPFDIKPK